MPLQRRDRLPTTPVGGPTVATSGFVAFLPASREAKERIRPPSAPAQAAPAEAEVDPPQPRAQTASLRASAFSPSPSPAQARRQPFREAAGRASPFSGLSAARKNTFLFPYRLGPAVSRDARRRASFSAEASQNSLSLANWPGSVYARNRLSRTFIPHQQKGRQYVQKRNRHRRRGPRTQAVSSGSILPPT